MHFPLRMAWRETRAAWRHFLYFFVCIAVGVGAVVGVGRFGSAMERAVTREARGLLGGDLEVRLSHRLSPEGEAVLASLAERGVAATHVSELAAMAAVVESGAGMRGRASQLVELKAVEAGYPFYGTLRVEPNRPLAELLAPTESGYGVVVQESLLVRLGLAVGDPVKIGEAVFTISGVLRKEPDRAVSLFSLGPRAIISREGLDAAQLVRPGSRVRERHLLRLPAGLAAEPLLFELRGRLAAESARVLSYQDAQPQLRRFLDQLTRYLGLIGLTALFVGGIGVASTAQAFLKEKLPTIAILKTLGADSGAVLRVYLAQTMVLGLIGSLAGALLGIGFQRALPPLMAGLMPAGAIDLAGVTPSPLPLVKGVAMGLLTTLLFALWPLLGIREIRPSAVLRREVAPDAGAGSPARGWRDRLRAAGLADPLRLLTAADIIAGLAALAVWQAGQWWLGLLFLGGLIAAVVALRLAAVLLVRALGRLARAGTGRSLAVRYALGNVVRPGSQAAGVLVAVGLGVMVIVTVSLLERALVRHLGESRPAESPSFFFIDIQPDQRDGFLQVLHESPGAADPQTTPLVRSRLHAIDGERIAADAEQGPGRDKESRAAWYRGREYVLTFREDLPKDNRVVKGTWWAPGEAGGPWVSVEEDAARNLGLDLGSTVEVDIQGTMVAATVRSIRTVQWETFSTNFYLIFSPGALEGAPVTYVATVHVPPEGEVALQQAVVAAFPNVTAINVRDVLDTFVQVIERLSLAIRAIALFCIVTGGLVLAAALSTTRYRRLYESVVLKALGATRGLLARAYAAEYALLGLVGGTIGVLLASLLSWGILEWIFDLPWLFQPRVLAGGLALTILLTLAVGWLTTFRLLGRRPLTVLRQE